MNLPADFELLLQETGMNFTHPVGFETVPVVHDQGWYYDHAVLSPSHNLKICYRIDSLSRMAADLADVPQGATVLGTTDINNIHVLNAMATLFNLSGGQGQQFDPFPSEALRAEFGAEWGANANFVLPQHTFGGDYKVAMLVALHRDNRANVFVLYLMRELSVEVRDLLEENFLSLTFSLKKQEISSSDRLHGDCPTQGISAMSIRLRGLLVFLAGGAVFGLIVFWISHPDKYPFTYYPTGIWAALLMGLPGGFAIAGLVELITGKAFRELERTWASLPAWKKAVLGLLIVILGGAVVSTIMALVMLNV